ncbi:HD domain-containing phosphohydrolase [Sulfuricaulis sp.]|jgi:HD-GYP domain-containing protein (c-di-GMP phosphodiesterase class II)|uniref:HD domain-containing phosphohydrolase n=1 Tax=Sulfuricaulis sp. TaxID=2003553 RepID=UPI00355A2522
MPDIHPSLLIVQEAELDGEVLLSFAPPERQRRFGTLAEIRKDIEGSILIVVPEMAQEALARRKTENASLPKFAVILWVNDPRQKVDRALLDHPQVAGVLDARCSKEVAYATLKSATALLRQGGEQRAAQMLEHVLEIGRALASEKDLDTLLGLILTHARHLTGADGASIYTRDGNGKLYFRLWQNASTGATSDAQKTLVGEYSIAGHVARQGKAVMLDDAYMIAPTAPYKFNPASDRSIGYHTQSLLTVPLTNKADEVVGVLQLINRKNNPDVVLRRPEDFANHVLPFDESDRAIALALAGQAGVALENSMLYADIENLFEGFIKASVQAIEARDPTTAGHSFRVADFTERIAVAADRADAPGLRDVSFTKEQLRELRYASLLHDFGKVGVRENVLVKAKKLQPAHLDLLKQRFRYARASLERRAYRRLLELHEARNRDASEFETRRREIERELAADRARLDEFLQHVLRANEPTVSHAEVSAELAEVVTFRFPGEDGEDLPLLHDFEFADLALSKGSLNAEERAQIESHVSHTYAFLNLIPWTKNLANLPVIAFSHHEKLDGSGYPRRLSADKIPVQSRIMTIADIYDALTAGDRPYKQGLPAEKALDILAAEARAAKIDATLYHVFVESGAWRLQR